MKLGFKPKWRLGFLKNVGRASARQNHKKNRFDYLLLHNSNQSHPCDDKVKPITKLTTISTALNPSPQPRHHPL